MAIGIGVAIPKVMSRAVGSAYSVGGKDPKLVADFDGEYYRANGGKTTFSNLITHSRAGNATMVDSDGLIKWGPHNLLTYSEEFDNAAWTADGASLSSGQADPEGGNSAYLMYRTSSGTGTSRIYSGSFTDIGVNTTSIWVKSSGAQWVWLAPVSSVAGVWFDVVNGVVGTETGNYTGLIVADGDFYKLSVTDPDNTLTRVRIYIVDSDFGSDFTKNGEDGVVIYGAHIYRSDLGGMVDNPDRGDSYVPTTSSAVYLPRRGHHKYNGDQWVNKGILVESEARTNLVQYSIPDSNWLSYQGTLTTDQAVSNDGNTNASKYIPTTNNTEHYIEETTSATSGTFTHSVYVKANGYDKVSLTAVHVGATEGATSGAVFDISSGLLNNVSAIGSGKIENNGNGWFRISYTYTVTGTVTDHRIRVSVRSDSYAPIWTPNGTDGIYIYGAQQEAASTPSSYIPTNGATVTRAAETVTVPYANLPWPTPTYIGDELVTNGTFDTDSDWDKGTGWSISGGTANIDGTQTAGSILKQELTVTAGEVYVFRATITDYTSGLFALSYINGTGFAVASPYLSYTSTGEMERTFVITSSGTVSFTISASANAIGSVDNATVREINPLSVSIAMMGEVDYADEGVTYQANFYYWFKDSNNSIFTFLNTFGTRTGEVVSFQEQSGISSQVSSDGNLYSPDLNVPFNIASRHGSTFINGAIDGVALTANTTPVALPDLSTTNLSLAYDYMGTISEFRIWDKDIGDTGIAEATKPSTEPSLSLTFDGQPSSFTNSGLTS